ncbi:MAG: phospholipase D-like domain-containing protein, partial [Leptospirales bacterium]
RNIADEYYDVHSDFNFSDRDVLFAGPVAARARESFEEFWASREVVPVHELHDVRKRLFDGGEQQPVSSSISSVRSNFESIEHILALVEDRAYMQRTFADRAYRVGEVTFVADAPGKDDPEEETDVSATLRELQERLAAAESSILIQTPYLILTDENIEGVQTLNEQNPEIRFRVSTNSLSATDNLLVYGVYYKLRSEYLDTTNMEIYEYKGRPRDGLRFNRNYIALAHVSPEQKEAWRETLRQDPNTPLTDELPGPGFGMHAKTVVVDDRRVIIGSHNFDPRSTAINTEVLFTIENEEFSRAMTRSIEQYMEPGNSWTIAPKVKTSFTPVNQCLGGASRALPVFDVYPWSGSASFEMKKPGGESLSRHASNFYENFEYAGQYPGTDFFSRAGTWLVSAFAVVLINLL